MDHLPSSSPFQQSVNNFFIKADKAADHTPVVSFASNSVNIFQKMVVLPLLNKFSPATITNSHYLTHIQDKKVSDCIFLMVPGAAMFPYLGKKKFFNANKNLEDQLGNFTTKEKESVKKSKSINVEGFPAAHESKLKEIEIARNKRIENKLPHLSSMVENLDTQLQADLAENKRSLEIEFSIILDSSSENITIEKFIEKFNSQINPRLKVLDQLKNNFFQLASFKILIQDCKQADLAIPLTPTQKDNLINQLNAQNELYKELHHDLSYLEKWSKGEIKRAQLKLKKDEYPCTVPNFISNPPSEITIQNKADLKILIKSYTVYVFHLEKINRNLEGMMGVRKRLLKEINEI